jgi:SDR family mycofactocin-dependent oxidoreductase
MFSVEGKVALVTGAGRGQGRAHATTLAAGGADVVAFDAPRGAVSTAYSLATASELEETAAAVRATGRRIVTAEGDVRCQADLDAAVAAGLEAFGHIDICIANAGIWTGGSAWELTEDQWNEVVDINLNGVWRTAKAVIPHMIERGQGGCLILLSSTNGLEAGGRNAHYTAAKHGVIGLMRSLALELAPYRIRCNAVCPGSIDTPMVNWRGAYDASAGGASGGREDFVRAGRRYAALADVGPLPAQAIADAVLWLVSDGAAYVTGVALPVDGGHLILPRVNPAPVE